MPITIGGIGNHKHNNYRIPPIDTAKNGVGSALYARSLSNSTTSTAPNHTHSFTINNDGGNAAIDFT